MANQRGNVATTLDVLGLLDWMARKPTGVSPTYYHEQIQVPWALISFVHELGVCVFFFSRIHWGLWYKSPVLHPEDHFDPANNKTWQQAQSSKWLLQLGFVNR